MSTVSSNTLFRNEIKNIPGLIDNLIKSNVDEIVILDGGSTDGGLEQLQRLATIDKRIKLICCPQSEGSSYKKDFKEVVRRNLMIEASKCEYVFYIDADERVDLDFKSKILPGIDFVVTERVHY